MSVLEVRRSIDQSLELMMSRVSVTITYHRSIDQSLELWTSPFISYCTLVLIWLISTAERVTSAARKATSYFTKARVTA